MKTINEKKIIEKYHDLTSFLIKNNLTISTMESCTGGMIGMLLSDMEGASAVIPGGVFTYSNEMKIAHGVPAEVIRDNGVYSIKTAVEMAAACRREFGTDIGIGVTGSIGAPDPNNADSVPGAVFVAVDHRGIVETERLDVPLMERHQCRLFIAGRMLEIIHKEVRRCLCSTT